MRPRLEDPAGFTDSATIDEPPNSSIARQRCRPQGDGGVSRVYAGGDLVPVAGAGRDDLKLGPAAPRRRFTRRRFTRRRLTRRRLTRRPILLRPLDVLRRPQNRRALV